MTVRVDGQFHGRLVGAVLEVFTDERHDAGSATDGHAGAVTVLDNYETLFSFRVEHCRVTQLVLLEDARSCKRRPRGYLKEVRVTASGYIFNIKSAGEILVPGYNS